MGVFLIQISISFHVSVCLSIYFWLDGCISIHAGLFIHHLLAQSSMNIQTDRPMGVGAYLCLDPHSRSKPQNISECWQDCMSNIAKVLRSAGRKHTCILKTCFKATVHCLGARSQMVEVSFCEKNKKTIGCFHFSIVGNFGWFGSNTMLQLVNAFYKLVTCFKIVIIGIKTVIKII